MQRLDAEHLRAEARKAPLGAILGGVPLCKRRKRAASRARLGMHAHAWAVHDALARDLKVRGDTTGQAEQATLEVRLALCQRGEDTLLAHCAKRALLLLALWLEPAVQQHFLASERDAPLARELLERVLPLAVPPFVKFGGAMPVQFCVDVQALLHMWAGERFWQAPGPPEAAPSAE
jgi:hypothetical protein